MSRDPGRQFNLMLVGLAGLNFVSHVIEHPLIIFAIALPCMGWRVLYEYQRAALPKTPLKFLLVSLTLVAVFVIHGTLLVLSPQPPC
ncbi:MAG: hypothetical protein R2827_10880 [Bdellovibrionales bacterium]